MDFLRIINGLAAERRINSILSYHNPGKKRIAAVDFTGVLYGPEDFISGCPQMSYGLSTG
jgi:hypothetical protein